MKFKYHFLILFLLSLTAVLSCNKLRTNGNDETETIKSVVSDFSYSYFNYRFNDAVKLCTEDMKKTISYVATNINEEDITSLRDKETAATCEAGDIVLVNDSCAEAECVVNDYYVKENIGETGKITNKSECRIMLIKNNGKWRVKKVIPLRNGKPSRD
ncbi:hypothetical protein HPS54_04255 [Prevotella sp. PCHR]|uniref:Lipoprotein n=1 Tax=Xylanibacter caecicola TaxID=2736294 RepID=A0ABX2AZP7_9BACT|nr:hypothetical protein [Xylanibacter caecicola]NPE24736.1 hypothetical protein [Xylanibacter caecicola]